ncbi:hypothetical protein V9T40_004900 [Parthenolecanium corni]|uniref:Uncharacterized protein n=1 Tax=Parthenolecanium corni TaxID=536013 RepID=A0AAN9Y2H8_9HEMI
MNGSNREVNGNRSCTYKGSSPSTKKVVTIVSPKEAAMTLKYPFYGENISRRENKQSSPKMSISLISQGREKHTELHIFGELVSIAPNERNWRGICIALLVIVAILALIFLFIVLLSKPKLGPFNPGTKFTADDVIKSEFKSSSFNGSWISGMF